jgi:hypothetical protein
MLSRGRYNRRGHEGHSLPGLASPVSEMKISESDGYVILSKDRAVGEVNLDDYTCCAGELYNVNNFFRTLSKLTSMENYGANSTVNYFTVHFKDICKMVKYFPVMTVGARDFMLFEITIPPIEWLHEHNLLNFTPYFFDYTDPGDGTWTNVFASCDNTIPFFKDVVPGTVKKICCTPCKTIADSFEAQGYLISRIPKEYLESCTYMQLIRVGIVNGGMFGLPEGMVTANYYKYNGLSVEEGEPEYFDELQITQLFDRPLEPISTATTRALHTSYRETIEMFQNYGYQVQYTYNYLSKLGKVKYAFQSFYDAMTLRPPIEMLGNNTGENYFISDDIDITSYASKSEEYFLYVLSVNQSISGCGLSSNIQIYNRANNSVVANGTYETAPRLPVMSDPQYPYSTPLEVTAYPTLYMSEHPISALLDAGVTTITVAERNAYNPRNFSYTSNSYVDTAAYFISLKIDEGKRSWLRARGCVVEEY